MSSRIDFFYYAFRNVLFISLPLVIISAIILSISRSVAVDGSAVDKVVLALPSSCTLSSKIDAEHNATILNGIYKKDIGQTSLGTFCNDENGYIIYAIGATNGEEGNTVLASSVSLPNSSVGDSGNYDIATGLAESGDISNWAMKLGYKTGDTSTTPPVIETNYENKYALIPNDWAKVVSKQAGTTDMDKGSNFTTTYAVYTSPTQPAGTYTGQVKFVLFHPSNSAKPTTLAEAYKNAGKQKIEITDPITGETGSFYKMQDMTTAICNATNVTGEASQTQLVDIRDNKLYWATKLLDGHCWMTQNLDTGINSSISFNSNNTDLNVAYNSSTGQYAEYNDGYTESNGIIYYTPASTATTIDFTGTTVSGWQNSNTTPYTANKTDSIETGHNSLGNYYNWTAAIASNNSSSLTQDTLSNISKNPKNSICPKGWRLPTVSNQSETLAGSTNEFARLNYLYNNNNVSSAANLLARPLYFTQPGYIGSNLRDYNTYGGYWSSTVTNAGRAYDNYFYINAVVFPYTDRRSIEESIRCVARQSL